MIGSASRYKRKKGEVTTKIVGERLLGLDDSGITDKYEKICS